MLRVAEQLYPAAVGELSWSAALAGLREVVDGHMIALWLRPKEGPPAAVPFLSTVPPDAEREYVDHWASRDPLARLAAPGLVMGRAFTSDPLLERRVLERTAFYGEWMGPNDIGRFIGIPLQLDDMWFCAVGLQRPVDSEPWQADDLRALEFMGVHLQRALRIHRALHKAGARVPGDGHWDAPIAATERHARLVAFGLPPSLVRVAVLLLEGLPDTVIADATGLSHHTVRTYVRRIFERLRVRNRIELTRKLLG